MHDVSFIIREPLLDPKERVLGYELTWQQAGGAAGKSSASSLVRFVAAQLHDPELGWRFGDSKLYLPAAPALPAEVLAALPPKTTVFTLEAADLADPDAIAALKTLREQGFGISAKYAELANRDKALLSLITDIEIRSGSIDAGTLGKLAAALKQSSMHITARQVGSWPEFDVFASLGLNSFVGNFYMTARPGSKAKGMNPAQTMILQLMQLVRQNADIKQLEGILKRDAALSYKLLRYINSVGFGLGAEIQSLRHAVTMLGYSPLYRWLSLLLATANSSGQSQALMHTAVIRGRFAELLGQGFVPKSEAENLFVAGMFSLLDRLLGIPMEQVLENIQLSDSVSEALLSRGGMYGPFLALAEACEVGNEQVGPLADALFINPSHVNQAHLSALSWAQNLQL